MSERDGEVKEDGKDCNKDERGSKRDGEVNKNKFAKTCDGHTGE